MRSNAAFVIRPRVGIALEYYIQPLLRGPRKRSTRLSQILRETKRHFFLAWLWSDQVQNEHEQHLLVVVKSAVSSSTNKAKDQTGVVVPRREMCNLLSLHHSKIVAETSNRYDRYPHVSLAILLDVQDISAPVLGSHQVDVGRR